MTRHPVFTIIHQPISVGPVDRHWLMSALCAAVFVYAVANGIGLSYDVLYGLATCAIVYGIGYWTRDDPTLIIVLFRAMQTRTHYDHAAYEPLDVEIRR